MARSRTRLLSHIMGAHTKEPEAKPWQQQGSMRVAAPPQPPPQSMHGVRSSRPQPHGYFSAEAINRRQIRQSNRQAEADSESSDDQMDRTSEEASDLETESESDEDAGSPLLRTLVAIGALQCVDGVPSAQTATGSAPSPDNESSPRRRRASIGSVVTSHRSGQVAPGSLFRANSRMPTAVDEEEKPQTAVHAVSSRLSTPRVQIGVSPNRPFSAPRTRWCGNCTSGVAAVALAADLSRAGGDGTVGIAENEAGVSYAQRPTRPSTAQISRPMSGHRSAIGSRPSHSLAIGSRPSSGCSRVNRNGLRPRSAFANLRRPRSAFGNGEGCAATERFETPPIAPFGEPQARSMAVGSSLDTDSPIVVRRR